MDNISIENENGKQVITIFMDRSTTSNLDALREAAKILQREVLRYESNHYGNFYR